MNTNESQQEQGWHRPKIRSLVRLSEQTNPTSISASSPEHHLPSITELKDLLKENTRNIFNEEGAK